MLENLSVWIWCCGILAWCAIRYPHQRRARKLKITSHRRSKEEQLLLSGAAAGLVLAPIVWMLSGWPSRWNYQPTPITTAIGTACMLGFLWLFYAVHQQLGRNWSITLEIREDHQLVTSGLFSRIRHPMYTSFWLWAFSQSLLIPNWFAGLTGLVMVGLLYFRRVHREEAMLRETFGRPYEDYMRRTKRLVPWII